MKKILMSMVALFAAVTMNAQNEMYVGGTLNFQTKANAANKSVITVAPEIGMSLNEQFGVGAVLSYTASQDVYNEFKINPYLRYNALEIGKVKVFVDGGIYYINHKPKDADADNYFGLNVTPGISYNLTDNISIVAHANPVFNVDISSPAVGDSQTTVNLLRTFNVNTFNFGFYYNF